MTGPLPASLSLPYLVQGGAHLVTTLGSAPQGAWGTHGVAGLMHPTAWGTFLGWVRVEVVWVRRVTCYPFILPCSLIVIRIREGTCKFTVSNISRMEVHVICQGSVNIQTRYKLILTAKQFSRLMANSVKVTC